jgi:hypothetical protein
VTGRTPGRTPGRARGRAPVVLIALLLTVTAAGCGSKVDEKKTGAEYVALGDSYTAGPGISPIGNRPCGRSKLNYPSLLAKALKVSSFVDRSCSGASTLNLDQPQAYGIARLNDPQLNVVDKNTRLITIGLGLNNNAISIGLLLVCLDPDHGPLSDKCQRYLAAPQSTIEDQMKLSGSQLGAGLAEIKKLAPNARIVVVGYPRLVPDQGSCPDRLPVPAAQVERMRWGMRYVNQVWADTAKQAGAIYVDMYAASEGHDICSADPWIADYKGALDKAFRLHPYGSYHEAVATQVERALGQ